MAKPPDIPSKRYFTIGEVSDMCGVKPHVLRYWEQQFPQIKPVKRRGNRRYYRQDDVIVIRQIRSLLHDEGYRINGARKHMARQYGENPELALDGGDGSPLKPAIQELEDALQLLSGAPLHPSSNPPPPPVL